MENNSLSEFDYENICDILLQIETSFNNKFFENEFAQFATFGELFKAIEEKIDLPNINGCSTQQTFNKLRSSDSRFKK